MTYVHMHKFTLCINKSSSHSGKRIFKYIYTQYYVHTFARHCVSNLCIYGAYTFRIYMMLCTGTRVSTYEREKSKERGMGSQHRQDDSDLSQ